VSGGGWRVWVGGAIAVLAPALAALATVLGQVGAPVWMLVVVTSAGGAVLAASGAYNVWNTHRAARSTRERELQGLLRTGLPVPTVSQVDPYSDLSVFRSTLAERSGGERPE
jgi:hypothetical protein